MPPKGTKKEPCPECGGSGAIVVGDLDTRCEACDGTGSVFQDAEK